MKRRNILGRLMLATTLVGGLSGLAPASLAQDSSANPTTVKVGILYLTADAGMFIAIDRGYFAEQGIKVELSRFTSGADIVALLATNNIDVGSGSASPGLYNAYRQGLQVDIVSMKSSLIAPNFGSGSLIVRQALIDDGSVKSIADLKGRTIGINNIQSTTLNYVARSVAIGGLTKDDVKLVELPFSQMIPGLQKGAVDAVFAFSPLSTTIEQKMHLGTSFPEAEAALHSDGGTANMMFYSPGFGQTETAKKFMVAHLKGLRDYYDAIVADKGGRTEVCQILNNHLKNIEPDCAGITMSGVEPNGLVNVESLEKFQREWVEWGLMSEPADIRAHINNSYLEYAWSVLGKM